MFCFFIKTATVSLDEMVSPFKRVSSVCDSPRFLSHREIPNSVINTVISPAMIARINFAVTLRITAFTSGA